MATGFPSQGWALRNITLLLLKKGETNLNPLRFVYTEGE
jgi:hypothetical protein